MNQCETWQHIRMEMKDLQKRCEFYYCHRQDEGNKASPSMRNHVAYTLLQDLHTFTFFF